MIVNSDERRWRWMDEGLNSFVQFLAEQEWEDLDFDQVQYLKQPKREQMVVALFYELIGAGVLKGYRTLRNNSIDQYDAFILYEIDKKEIAFPFLQK